jgi:hypothetical protein
LTARPTAQRAPGRRSIREHDRGRALDEILQDRYVQNRLSAEQQRRLLDRPEVVGAVSHESLESTRAMLET